MQPVFRRGAPLAVIFALVLALLAPAASAQTPEAGEGAAPAPQLPATLTDATGAEVTVEDISRIVPLSGAITETVFALGLGANVVAVDVSATYPEAAQALPKIGFQRDLNAEAILAMEPTVVIGDEAAGPPAVLDQVRAAGVPVVILANDTSIEGPPALVRGVGQALGVPEVADAVAGDIEATIAGVAEMVAGVSETPRVAFVYLRGPETQLLAGTNTEADTVITAAGGINVGAESGAEGYFPVTAEALVAAAPDVILVTQGGLASVGGMQGLLAVPGVAQTPAGENERIIAFDDLYFLGFGPRIGDAIHDVALALHPELDGEPLNPQWQGTDIAAPPSSPEASPAA